MTKKTLVLKFGGSSVAEKKALMNVAEIVRKGLPNRICVVVSALGKAHDYDKVTDELIGLKTSAKKEKVLAGLKRRHIELIDECIDDDGCNAGAKKEIGRILGEIKACMADPTYPLECFGEKMSAQIVYFMLKSKGLDMAYVDALLVIHFINRNPYFQKIRDSSKIITDLMAEGKIVITEGFVANENGKMTCMCRGGSDQTATLIGEAIKADEVLIYSDQDGILTADPRIVKNARSVVEISYPEAEEMAGHGTKIIYPKILEPLKGSNIPIIIKNTFNPDHKGTRIVPSSRNKGIKCITMVRQLHTSIHNPAMIGSEGFLAKVFSAIGKDIDVIISGNPIIGYTTTDERNILDKLKEFGEVRQKSVHTIAIVGEDVEENPRVLNKVTRCLSELGLEIEFISHDRRSAAIYLGVVENGKTNTLINMLHKELIEGM
ncbi:MAG: aspartate kinase [archaeon]